MTDRVLDLGPDVYARMQSKDPVKRYKKTILAKVFVLYIDPFSGEFKGATLSGDPKLNEETCYINVWSEKEMLFFEGQNAKHFKEKRLIEVPVKDEVIRTEDMLTDAELAAELDKQYFTFNSLLNKMTKKDRVVRLLEIAKEKDKSQKMIERIQARISELDMIKEG